MGKWKMGATCLLAVALITCGYSYDFESPDAVRGIYITGHTAGGNKMDSLIDFVDHSDLNAMVIDVKDDQGFLTFTSDDPRYESVSRDKLGDVEALMETLAEHDIYPIARIVTFKDSLLSQARPDWSFLENGSLWSNRQGDSFVNPFEKDVWDYNVEVAKQAAELGFQDIQFDYVRFPEGFETRADDLDYSLGDYAASESKGARVRVDAVSDFVTYAREELSAYDVDISVDIFGYAATIDEAPGIGQNFSMIAENVDVISAMIYPSHWTSHFGIETPDKEPYALTNAYAEVEHEVLASLDEAPVTRPWIQDFTASWLGKGNYIPYGAEEVEAQIRALNDNGIDEYLLWNAGNTYTEGVNYAPDD
ncbi:putative glycoside hydrolase [Natribacillus halophilus]|uniref:DUF4015 domain-containing protein n=1 Tax=Natribacillus halophilus TaxID=549003 RepID=A0A1G8LFW4_9BACI|nr:putative glycoside hydrolase [Natribacillus halophilus]SDI54571.1 hypothetical protein SAMN04488123_10371 [Natribacillus halophilus]